MTADTTRLHGLRHRAGQTEVELAAFEIENPYSHLVPALRERHNALLRDHIESRQWLEIATAQIDGRMNFTPTLKKTK